MIFFFIIYSPSVIVLFYDSVICGFSVCSCVRPPRGYGLALRALRLHDNVCFTDIELSPVMPHLVKTIIVYVTKISHQR